MLIFKENVLENVNVLISIIETCLVLSLVLIFEFLEEKTGACGRKD